LVAGVELRALHKSAGNLCTTQLLPDRHRTTSTN
jgi:hypothetical protein